MGTGAKLDLVTIRQIETDEVMTFHEFRLAGLKQCPEAFGSTYDEELQFSAAEVESRFLGSGDDFVLGAYEEWNLVGMVGLQRATRIKRRHGAFVWGMYVAPVARGKGIGDALLDELVARAKKIDGLLQLHLSVITKCQAARRLYVAHVFESYGVEPRAHNQDGDLLDIEHMIMLL